MAKKQQQNEASILLAKASAEAFLFFIQNQEKTCDQSFVKL